MYSRRPRGQLARHPDQLELGGEQREITVMFTDVRGFTTIAESSTRRGWRCS